LVAELRLGILRIQAKRLEELGCIDGLSGGFGGVISVGFVPGLVCPKTRCQTEGQQTINEQPKE
jgi:hypothetical protein